MLDKLAGIPTQIRALERRLKDMDASKVSPAKIKEVTDTIKNLKELLKEKQEKREQRKKDKETKAQEVSKEEVKVEAAPDALIDKVEHSPKIAPHIITPDSIKEHDKIVERVEKSPEVAPAIVSEKKEESLKKFSIDDKVEPVRGGNGSWGMVMREPDTNGDPLCYVKWIEGDLSSSHGMGGYYPNDLKLKAEEKTPNPEHPCPCWEDQSAYCPKCKNEKTSDLKTKYDDLLKDLKDEHKEALEKHDHIWIKRLDQKIKELEEKIQEKFSNEKEGGAQNNSEGLVVMDHTPPRANSGPDAGGKDSEDEFQDEWAMPAGVELESKRGIPGSLYTNQNAQAVSDRIKSEVKAPYVNSSVSTLGGPEDVGIYFTISTEPKEAWTNGILENSRYGKFVISNDGELECHSGSFNHYNEPRMNFRKRNVKSVDQLIQILNSWVAQVQAHYAASPKQASLKKNAISINVFNKSWNATPVTKEGKLSYEITDNTGKKVLSIKPLNGQEMNAEHLKWAVQRELTQGYKQARLTSDLAFLKSGSKVLILATDKKAKRIKFADLSNGVRGWASESKFKLIASENETVKHQDHIDEVLGNRNGECLTECPQGSGNIGWKAMDTLLSTTQPPATPESLNDLESSQQMCTCGHGRSAHLEGCKRCTCTRFKEDKNDLESAKTCPICKGKLEKDYTGLHGKDDWWCPNCGEQGNNKKKQSAKECPDCHGNFVGAEGEKCPTCGRFAVDKQALKTALPHIIPNQRAYENDPVEKKARGCDQCDAAMINGVFCHETGCPNQRKEREQEEEFDIESSLNIQAHIRHEDGKWVIYSHDYKKKLGTYDSKAEAVHRLKSIEYWKSHKGSLVQSPDGKVYKIGSCDFVTDMVNLEEIK